MREIGAQVGRTRLCQRGAVDRLAPMLAQELNQPHRRRLIGAHGMRRPPPVARQMLAEQTWERSVGHGCPCARILYKADANVPRPRPRHEFRARPARLPRPARDARRAGVAGRRPARPAPVARRGVGARADEVRRGGRRQPPAQPDGRAPRPAADRGDAAADRMDVGLLSRRARLGRADGVALDLGAGGRADRHRISRDRARARAADPAARTGARADRRPPGADPRARDDRRRVATA